MVQPHMTAAAGQDWNGFVFGHPFFAMDAKIDLPLCGRVAIHPLNDAGLVGTGFGSGMVTVKGTRWNRLRMASSTLRNRGL